MNKFLLESGWKTEVQKHKLKDTTVQQALAGYAKTDGQNFSVRAAALVKVTKAATDLKKSKDISAHKDVEKYLGEMIKGGSEEMGDLNQADQAKSAAAGAAAQAAKSKADQAAYWAKIQPELEADMFAMGQQDGFNDSKNRRGALSKLANLQKKYDDGYAKGKADLIAWNLKVMTAQKTQTTISELSDEQIEYNKTYNIRKARRQNFIDYLSENFSVEMPNDQ